MIFLYSIASNCSSFTGSEKFWNEVEIFSYPRLDRLNRIAEGICSFPFLLRFEWRQCSTGEICIPFLQHCSAHQPHQNAFNKHRSLLGAQHRALQCSTVRNRSFVTTFLLLSGSSDPITPDSSVNRMIPTCCKILIVLETQISCLAFVAWETGKRSQTILPDFSRHLFHKLWKYVFSGGIFDS